MIKKITYSGFFILALGVLCSCSSKLNKDGINLFDQNISIAEAQYNYILNEVKNTDSLPNTINPDGTLHLDPKNGWVCGFFPGSLWYLYELTGKEKWKQEAIRWTETLDTIQYNTGTHDIGFMIYCSYGNALRLTGNKKYEQVLVNASKSLSSRFNEKTGCILSWNDFIPWGSDTIYNFPVIVDNMMNLELLYEGSKLSGDSTFKKIADIHAKTTIKNHFRPDYSSYHVVCYDKENGNVITKKTHQGFSDNSSWARGQAWGLYGYTMCYRETGNTIFLNMAENIASYIMHSKYLPEDKIPLWDYHVNQPGYLPDFKYTAGTNVNQRDVSASAITASALLDLSTLVSDGKKYFVFATDILNNLSTNNYRTTASEKHYFILKHSVGSVPHGRQIDVPLNYADYYFLEALARHKKITTAAQAKPKN